MIVSSAMARVQQPTALFLIWSIAFAAICASSLASARRCHGPRTAFSFPDMSQGLEHLTLIGDAAVRGSVLQISGSQPQTVGGLFYSQPVRLHKPGKSPSFSTSFSFSMDSNSGDGLAFIITPTKDIKGMNGPWLGLSAGVLGPDSSDRPALANTIAIEFDTSMNQEVQDPSENHVGLDIESMVSVATAEVSDGLSLNSGLRLYAWIDYYAPLHLLEVRLSESSSQRPENPILSHSVDLSGVWKEEMYVGFSSSTGDSPQRHIVYSWSFEAVAPKKWKGPKHGRPGWFGPHFRHGDWHPEHDEWHHDHDHDHDHHDDHHHHPEGGFPGWHHDPRPDDWQHIPHHRPEVDKDDFWFDSLDDVWEILSSLLLGAACGAVAAAFILVVWALIRRYCMRDNQVEDAGILYGFQKLASAGKLDGNGYQQVATKEPEEGTTVSA